MAVSNYGSNTVSFISGTKVVGTTTVGTNPDLFAYDPYWDRFLVANMGSHNVTSMNANDPTDKLDNINIPVGIEPTSIAFDYADSYDYVSDAGTNNLTVIDGLGSQIGSVSLGSGTAPVGVVWDQAELAIEAANEGTSTISEVQGVSVVSTITGPSSAEFNGIEYDPATDQLFTVGFASATAYIYGTLVPSQGPVAAGTSCAAGSGPEYPAYDPVSHDIYVPDFTGDSLYILNGACQLVDLIHFKSGAEPVEAAFNPTNNYVYVTDFGLNQVYAYNGDVLIGTVTNASQSGTLDGPFAIAFDPGDAVMAVKDALYADHTLVAFISGTTVVGTTRVGNGEGQFAYDPHSDRLLVTNFFSDNVTSMKAISPFPNGGSKNINIPVGSEPNGVAFDPEDSRVYVANEASGNVTVIGGGGAQYGAVSVGSTPEEDVWDQENLSMYVANLGTYPATGYVSVIRGLTEVTTLMVTSTMAAVEEVLGIAYDQGSNQVFVTTINTSDVFVYT
jgi:DNA-binding beta-propeller fold protein YncE